MPLKGKYLKYKPEITIEIFKLIYQKLFENKLVDSLDYVDGEYKFFSTSFNILKLPTGANRVGCYAQNWELFKETTVQEILGYDPFVKEEFVLPEKWWIKITSENKDILNSWKKSQPYTGEIKDNHIYISEVGGLYINDEYIDKYTIITFDQFKKYVLKDNNEVTKEKVIDIKEIRALAIELSAKGKTDRIKEALIHFKSGSISALKEEDYSEFYKMLGNIYDRSKQPLKQAVHCKTQEEWDFVLSKINYKLPKDSFRPGCNTIVTVDNEYEDNVGSVGDITHLKLYQILSFQEWCDLNGYKMKKEVKFEVGQWVCNKSMPFIIGKIDQIKGELVYYRGCDKKENVRHATPEEINNHLISIGQIPAGEPLNNGIEPDKDGMFKYTTNVGSTFVGNCSTLTDKIPVKPKLILSIDDEELPMVNIIKTNSIKQLLNND